MLLVNLLFDLFMQQTSLLNVIDDGHISYHEHHVINGYDRPELADAVEGYVTDMEYEFEKLLRAINRVRDSHA